MMYLPNAEKNAFIIERGTYYYRVIPFHLKNFGATYQRMVNKDFKDLLRNTMEAYVDDMILKCKGNKSHVKKLTRVFNVLQKHSMQLNSNKCSFEVQLGKFLGYMITQRGIEAT